MDWTGFLTIMSSMNGENILRLFATSLGMISFRIFFNFNMSLPTYTCRHFHQAHSSLVTSSCFYANSKLVLSLPPWVWGVLDLHWAQAPKIKAQTFCKPHIVILYCSASNLILIYWVLHYIYIYIYIYI